jgi:putative transposase
MRADQKLMNETLRRVFRRLHYPIEVILVCVRWYVAYPLSLRHLEEMMAERGVAVDHSTIHRWAVKMLPVLAAICRRGKRPVGKSWRMDETYIKVAGQWKYLYRAVDKTATRLTSCCAPSAIMPQPAPFSNAPSVCTTCQRR